MGPLWMLWVLLFVFSTSEAAQPGAAGLYSTDRIGHHDNMPHTLVQLVIPPTPLMFTNEERQQTGPFHHVSKDSNTICVSGKYLTRSTRTFLEATIPPRRRMDIKEERFKTLEVSKTEDELVPLLEAASPGPQLGAVHQQQVRKCPVVAPYDDRHSQQAGLRDLLLRQVMQINTIQGVPRMVSGSSMCRGYHFLLGNPKPLLNYTEKNHDSWKCPGREVDQDLTLGDLVSYLISMTSGRQLYLVYDDVTPGVEVVVRSFQEVLGDTTLLPYDPNILLLTEVLTSNYHVQAMRNVFILCSATHLYNLFQQVRDKVLESPTIQWLVIVDEDLTEELPLLLREGTQVALVQRVTPQKAQLLSSRVDPDGQVRFHQVGWWSVNGTRRSSSHQVKGRLLPDLQQLYSDFQGRQLLVTINNNWPFIKIITLKNGTIIPVSGIDLSLISALGEKLNFTYRLVRPPDGKWGGPQPDGTISGVIGQVARHEAHVTLCEVTITDIRETVVDFTMPYCLESSTLVSPAPKERNRSFAILSPFTLGVWLCICLVTVLVGPLLYLVTHLLVLYLGEEDTAQYSLQSFSFNMYRSLMVQGNLITSHRWSLRFIFLFWYLFSLCIQAMYSGTLTAALAVVSFEKPIDSLYDLAQAHQDGYTISILGDSSYEASFESAKSGIYQEVWQLFNHEERDRSFLSSPDAGFDMVLREKYVFFHTDLPSKLKAIQRGRDRFHLGRQTFLPQPIGIACSSGSPYRDIISFTLIRMTEAGLVDKWADDEVNTVSQFVTTSRDSGTTAISLQHLQAAFFIVVLGFTISVIVLLMEITASRWWQSIGTVFREEV